LVLVDLDAEATKRAAAVLGERTLGLGGDVSDGESIAAPVAAAVERFGGLDVVIANAGISPEARTARVYESALFEKVIDVNLLGVWRTVHAALPHVVARRGQIVLISSIYAFTNGTFVSAYAASKAAVEQLGRALRVELAPHGVTVGVAYFGFVSTEMVRLAIQADPLGTRFEALIPRPLRKRISPAEPARCSPGASSAVRRARWRPAAGRRSRAPRSAQPADRPGHDPVSPPAGDRARGGCRGPATNEGGLEAGAQPPLPERTPQRPLRPTTEA